MPPKAKFTPEEILCAALDITREHGIGAVTARELGNRLGSSARPIFTVFKSMEEVRELIILKSKELYGQYVEEGLKSKPPFRGVGIAYIRFAMEEPRLAVQEPYHLDRKTAEKIYQHLWTYTHGIAAMFATGLCSYTAEQLEERLTEVFQGLLLFEKNT